MARGRAKQFTPIDGGFLFFFSVLFCLHGYGLKTVSGLKYVHKFFDTLPRKRWSLILFPLSVG